MTTLVALVGRPATRVAGRLSAGNVSVHLVGERPGDPLADAAHLAEAWRAATRRSSVYTVVDADPLAPLVDAWAHRLTGAAADLEVLVGLAPDLPAPDFYLVDPGVGDPRIHWYAHHLAELAPTRTIVADLTPPAVLERLSALPFGPGLPSLSRLAETARDYVPLPELSQPLTTPSGTRRATGAASPDSEHASTTESTSL